MDRKSLEQIRLMAVERVREGASAAEVIEGLRLQPYDDLQMAESGIVGRPGGGLRMLRATLAPGRARSLTPRQESQVFRWINGRDPRQYGLDFGLWTRRVVSELIEKRFDIKLGVTAVGGANFS